MEEKPYEPQPKERQRHIFGFLRNLGLGTGSLIVAGVISNFYYTHASSLTNYSIPEKPAVVEYFETAKTIRNNVSRDLQVLTSPQGVPYPNGAYIDLLEKRREQERREKVDGLETSLQALDKDIELMAQNPQIRRFQEEMQELEDSQEAQCQTIKEICDKQIAMRLVGLFGGLVFLSKAGYHHVKTIS